MDKSIFYAIQEFRGDIYKRLIVQDTFAGVEEFIYTWRRTERQVSMNLVIYKVTFTENARPRISFVQRVVN